MDGDLDLDAWCREEDTAALRATVLGVKGIGNYAANHLLMLLGHYDQIPCDSEVRSYLGISPKAPQKEVERWRRSGMATGAGSPIWRTSSSGCSPRRIMWIASRT